MYGKDAYKVETRTVDEVQLDGDDKVPAYQEVYVLKKDTVLNEDVQDDLRDTSLYYSEDDTSDNERISKYKDNDGGFSQYNMRRREGENRNFSPNIIEEDIKKIKNSLAWYLGDMKLVDDFLKAFKHILFRYRTFKGGKGRSPLGLHNWLRGTIDFKLFSSYIERGVPIHEVMHELTQVLEGVSKGRITVKEKDPLVTVFINNIINEAWRDLHEHYSSGTIRALGFPQGGYSTDETNYAKVQGKGHGPILVGGISIPSFTDSQGTRVPIRRRQSKVEESSPIQRGREGSRGQILSLHDFRCTSKKLFT